MNRSGKRHRPTAFDALDVPLLNRKRPLLHCGAHFTRFSVKLRSLLDQEKYSEAKLLFTEMVKSSKYDFKNLWQAGIEVIGRSSPNELVGYLKAVFISAPPKLSSETFNVYIDQLLIEEKWAEALEEMELRYNAPIYHHPIILRKMAICSYNLWDKAYQELPKEYFEQEEQEQENQFDFDILHVKYVKYKRAAIKYLAEAHQTYLRDSEIFEIYFTFLQRLKDKELKKSIVLQSLAAFKKDPEYYLLYSLMKHNKKNRYFNNEDYIVPLYEFDPFLDEKVKHLHNFCKRTIRRLKLMDQSDDEEEKTRLNKLIVRIFRLFVTRIEHGNIELWFCKAAVKICRIAINQEIEDVYFYYNVDELLRSAKQDTKEIIQCADELKEIISDFILQNNQTKSPSESPKDNKLEYDSDIEITSPLLEQETFYKQEEDLNIKDLLTDTTTDQSEIEDNGTFVEIKQFKLEQEEPSIKSDSDKKIFIPPTRQKRRK